MNDELAWTEAGRSALADEETWGLRPAWGRDDAALRAHVAATIARFAPAWERGRDSSDEVGREVIARALAWNPEDAVPSTIEDAAAITTLLGARSDGAVEELVELLVRHAGAPFVIRTIAAMWRLRTDYDDPGDESELAIRVLASPLDGSSAQDASVSHAKGTAASYLRATLARSTDEARARAAATVDDVWDDTPLEIRAPLAVAAGTTARIEDIARDLLDGKTSSHPHFGLRTLPQLVRDLALLDRLHERGGVRLGHTLLDRLGIAVLPLYERTLAAKSTSKYQRLELLTQLGNVRGSRAARMIAPFAEKGEYAKAARAYFERYPELLEEVLCDPDLDEHLARLGKLRDKLAKRAKPAAKRRAR